MVVTRNQLPVTREGEREMKEFRFDFENLVVYQKALNFIDKIFRIYKGLANEYKFSLGNNLVRAALSVANNIAEGNDKRSIKERNRYMAISSDSARECVSVINVLNRQNLVDREAYLNLRNDAREITSMLKGLTNSSRA